jgi:exonuclease III
LLIAALGGGWYFFSQYEIQGLNGLAVKSRSADTGAKPPVAGVPSQPPVPERLNSIRVATFNVNPLDGQKLSKPHVVSRLVQVIQQFDVIALQGIHCPNQSAVVQLLEQVNAAGRHYDFALPPSVGRDPVEQYSAFVFDRATLEIDRRTVYSVEDPTRQIWRKPLAASFRARGVDPSDAFTFTLINVHTSPEQASAELDLLDDVFRAVRDSGRNEDDILMLGDIGADDRHLSQLGQVPYLTCSVFTVPTTLQSRQMDNVLFDRRATVEFTGRAGVFDLMRQFNLPARDVMEISSHFPVWAEFSIYEGGQAGHVATDPAPPPR